MNSTLKSLLFWMVLLVVVGVLIWNFSTKFQHRESRWRSSSSCRTSTKARSPSVVITGNEITGVLTTATDGDGNAKFRTYAPTQFDGLANKLIDKRVVRSPRRETTQPVGDAAVFLGAHPADDRLLGLLHAPDAERRQQGALVRQEQGEAVVELAEEGDVQGRRRRRRSEGRAPGNHRVPQGAAEIPEARRPHSEGRAADGLARHRQDAARARGRRRSQRAVLLDQRLRLRRDVRRRRRLARPRSVRAGQEERALHRLHRRDRRGRPPSRRRPRRRPRRARADAQPAARRDGRLRIERRRHPRRRDQPSRRARSGAAASRPLRSPHRRQPSRRQGPRGHPRGPHRARFRCPTMWRFAVLARGLGRLLRRRSREPGERSGAERRALQPEGRAHARLRVRQGQGADGIRAPLDDHQRRRRSASPRFTRRATRCSRCCCRTPIRSTR